MKKRKRTDADEHAVDDQPLQRGALDDDAKLDIALEGSMLTSEPPQISEPRTALDDKARTRPPGDETPTTGR